MMWSLLDPGALLRVVAAAMSHAGAIAAPPATPGPGVTPPPPAPHWPPTPDVLPPDIDEPELPEPPLPVRDPPQPSAPISRWTWYVNGSCSRDDQRQTR